MKKIAKLLNSQNMIIAITATRGLQAVQITNQTNQTNKITGVLPIEDCGEKQCEQYQLHAIDGVGAQEHEPVGIDVDGGRAEEEPGEDDRLDKVHLEVVAKMPKPVDVIGQAEHRQQMLHVARLLGHHLAGDERRRDGHDEQHTQRECVVDVQRLAEKGEIIVLLDRTILWVSWIWHPMDVDGIALDQLGYRRVCLMALMLLTNLCQEHSVDLVNGTHHTHVVAECDVVAGCQTIAGGLLLICLVEQFELGLDLQVVHQVVGKLAFIEVNLLELNGIERQLAIIFGEFIDRPVCLQQRFIHLAFVIEGSVLLIAKNLAHQGMHWLALVVDIE